MQATKSATQPSRNDALDTLLGDCLTMTYNAVHYGRQNRITNRKGMKEFYRSLRETDLPSCYKVAAITRACAVLKSREKSEKRRVIVSHHQPLRRMICITSGFFISAKGRLFIPLKRDKYTDVQLNHHLQEKLAGTKVRSLTITPDSLSLCFSGKVEPIEVRIVYGVDRNEKNLTFGNRDGVVQIDMSETVRIKQTTREILGSFKRNDVRVGRKLASKYWKRATDRTNQMLHAAANLTIDLAAKSGAALAVEDLTGISRMYRKGNAPRPDYRFRLNSWPYRKVHRMLEYKATWKGVTLIPLTKAETYGSSMVHHACGERLRRPEKGDIVHRRMLWCQPCKTWVDRDANAAVVLSLRGLAWFASSLPRPGSRLQQVSVQAGEKGLAGEAMKGNPTKPVILRVDASKLACGPMVYNPSHASSS
ncbi:MAG: transposase [Nitrososphaerales archaeon]|nr:transposase [Nitrososphaerales archaeon]